MLMLTFDSLHQTNRLLRHKFTIRMCNFFSAMFLFQVVVAIFSFSNIPHDCESSGCLNILPYLHNTKWPQQWPQRHWIFHPARQTRMTTCRIGRSGNWPHSTRMTMLRPRSSRFWLRNAKVRLHPGMTLLRTYHPNMNRFRRIIGKYPVSDILQHCNK